MDKPIDVGVKSLLALLSLQATGSTGLHRPNPRNGMRGFRTMKHMTPIPKRLAEKDRPHQGEREKARRARQALKQNGTEHVREG